MTGSEIRKRWIEGKEVACCGECRHYVEHYVYSRATGRYVQISSGHCTHPRCKSRRAWDVCGQFERKERER